jgi:HEAT repeat protein
LAGKAPATEEGLAFSETDDYTLVARGSDRLVCMRKIASCTLFDVRTDPLEKKPIADRQARVQELRSLTAAIERENGKLEANPLPEALRRGLQGDVDAAEDVAALFDDARVDIRREAARCAFRLKAPAMEPQLRRAAAKDEDAAVKKWSTLALLRLGAGTAAGAEAILRDAEPRFRSAAAMAMAEQGDARGESELVARWESAFVPGAREHGELEEAREILAAFAKIRARSAVPALTRSLEDVRLRSYVVDALADVGDPRAVPALVATFTNERYVDVRPKEARALVKLGARDALLPPLRRFAGTPLPMPEAFEIARDAGLLVPAQGGWKATGAAAPQRDVDVQLHLDGSGPARLFVMGLGDGAVTADVDDRGVDGSSRHGALWTAELMSNGHASVGPRVHVRASSPTGIAAIWLVRRAEDVPPPAPREWLPADAGPDAATKRDAAADGGPAGQP